MKYSTTVLSALLLAASATTYAAGDPPKDAKNAEQRLQEAQKRLEEAAREIAELSGRVRMEHLPDHMVFLGRNPNRAMLGIAIGEGRENQSDDGVAVLSVSPGGPAAGAGIKAGDVIVELNGKPMKADKDSSPREKLLAEVGKLSPGDEATVRYLRDGKAGTAKLKVESLPREEIRRMRIEIPDVDHLRDRAREFEAFRVFGGPRGALGDMELVPLTPKLGQYFGADKGLLIVRAPEDKDMKLEDGDVLVDIDGRAPSDPGHALRILRSYEPGEKVTLNILRQRKKVAVSVTIPEREGRGPRPPAPPRPAVAPLPPNAPMPGPV
jgi:S1-C subfamily serine protease